MAPQSRRRSGFSRGKMVASAERRTPFILRTIKEEPACKAPVFPALIIASAPSFKRVNATPMEEFLFSFMIDMGSSSIVSTSSVCTMEILSGHSVPSSFMQASIFASSPTRIRETSLRPLRSLAAESAPFTISTGAKSPLIASIINLIIYSSLFIGFSRINSSAFATARAPSASFLNFFGPFTFFSKGATMPKLAFIG